ncbi:hypothetical protein ACTWJ8_34475 [Streptomyces sp. SDT5-1]|uniref:hypothetical protein n=1 Tax=Streptomyces sp. SDT5-1 TaxID=3406418 RepID=UPI003FD58858
MECEVKAGAAEVTRSQFGPQPAYDIRPGAGDRAHVVIGSGVRRLYVPEPIADLRLEREPGAGALDEPLSVILPTSAAQRNMRLTVVGLEVAVQRAPAALVLGEGSTLVSLQGCDRLAALEITGAATLRVPLHATTVTFAEGRLAPADELTADEVRGEAVVLTGVSGRPRATLRSGALRGVRAVSLASGTRLLVRGVQGDSGIVFGGPGELAVEGGSLDSPVFRGELGLTVREGGRILRARGTVHTLSAEGGSRVDGHPDAGLVVAGVESVEDAELSAVNAFELRPHSLAELKKAAHVSFWAGRSASDGVKRARAMDRPGEDRELARYWSDLLHQVEESHDHAQVRMTARRAELDYRRKSLPLWSADRLALEILRPIQYGQSVLAPLVAQLIICVCGALLLRSIDMLADDSARGTLVMVVRLYFAALAGTGRNPAFRPDSLPGMWDTAVWLVCLLTSIFLFGAAVLAARRRIIAG